LRTLTYIGIVTKGPKALRICFLLLPLFLLFTQPLFSQAEIGGIINDYYRVESIVGNQAVTVSNPGTLQEGDTVLLIQMKGIGILTNLNDYGKPQDINDAGNYEFLLIDRVVDNTVHFTREFLKVGYDELGNEKAGYDAAGTVQLVKVKGYQSARVTGTLTAKPWDRETGTGGILALIVTNTLTLEADIDLTAKGFGGGKPVVSDGLCGAEDPDLYKRFSFSALETGKAGLKGEGPATWYLDAEDLEISYPVDNTLVYGRGRIATGGGGGNGKFAGGGGGSNYGQGGYGGGESQSCPELLIDGQGLGGEDGYRLEGQLLTAEGFVNRFFMGGGGGGSTGYGGREATAGGNGGGMVIIIANHIEGSEEFSISADGGTVLQRASAGAGGGGGGGTIVASADNYHGTLRLSVRGGNGGHVEHASPAGPGGGGGGGSIIHSGISLPPQVVTYLGQGAGGSNHPGGTHGSTNGSAGELIEDLEISLNGLLFNGIRTERNTICADTRPGIIEGTRPRGGTPDYFYSWSIKTPGNEWIPIPGETGMHYQPEVLYETTVFKRTVTDDDPDPVVDVSNFLTIYVQPKISGNIITGGQTICESDLPAPLSGPALVIGGLGEGNFEYIWHKSTDAEQEWAAAGNNDGQLSYSPPPLFNTTSYRRIATSGVCIDSSNIVLVSVIPSIRNNIFEDNQTICQNAPAMIEPTEQPAGGTGYHTFIWEKSTDDLWDPVDENGSNAGYASGMLQEDARFRRIVESGPCKDTSNTHTVFVLPLISENNISQSHIICFMDSPEPFTGTEPAGGDGNYRYNWEFNVGSGWLPAAGNPENRDYLSPELSDTTYFRRVVFSGAEDACTDTSNTVIVEFHPFSHAELTASADTICTGEQRELSFRLNGDGPWNLMFTDGKGDFLIENISTPLYNATVSPGSEDSTTYIYRLVSLTDKYGCRVRPENLSGSATIRVYAYPDPDPGIDAEVCGRVYQLNASPGLGNMLWEADHAGVVFSHETNASTSVTVPDYGTRLIKYTETNWQCRASRELSVTFYQQPEKVNAGADQTLQFLFDTYLEAELPGSMTSAYGRWDLLEGSGTIVFPDDARTLVTGLGFGANVLQWTVFNGVCEPVSDLVTIKIKDLDTPNAFSPNNSGYNDRFVIRGLENSINNELTIFNRQGNVVYSSVNYQNDWDGRNHNGKPLPEDTYYYVLRVDSRPYKGFIILKR
jgi:gliding motility-associated-like protein